MAYNVRPYQTACSRTAGHRISEKGEGFAAVTLGLEVGVYVYYSSRRFRRLSSSLVMVPAASARGSGRRVCGPSVPRRVTMSPGRAVGIWVMSMSSWSMQMLPMMWVFRPWSRTGICWLDRLRGGRRRSRW